LRTASVEASARALVAARDERDGTLMSVSLAVKEDPLEPGPARALFDTGVSVGSVIQPDSLYHHDVSTDGERFLVNWRVESRSPLLLVWNWRASLGAPE
jgi:hypothetical protein